MSTASTQHRALAALAVLVLAWAFSWVMMKAVMQYAGPFDFAGMRFTGGALVLFAIIAIRRHSLKPPPLRLTLAVGLFQTAGFQALAQIALVNGGAGHTSLLAYTMPFWVVLLMWLFFRERPSSRQWLGLILAAAGLVCVMQPWHGMGSLRSSLLAIGGGICWGIGTVLSKRMFERHAPAPMNFTAWQMLIGGIAIGIIALCVPQPPIDWTPTFIFGLLYCIVLGSALAWLLWLFVVRSLPATIAGLSSLAVPVTAVLLSWALLAERPDGWETLGIILIVLGLLAVSGIGRRRT